MKETPYIWKNGKLIDWKDATTHVLSHALHYGTGIFEGIRAYHTDQGPAIFRADEHFKRLIESAKIYCLDCGFSADQLKDATCELIRQNKLKSCYIRPLIYVGYGELGIKPGNNPIDTIIAAWEWGSYLGEDGLKNGVRCKMSSWMRLDSRSLPPLSKCSGHYTNSVMAKTEALRCGYDEAILFNSKGTVAEGPGENLFLIKDGVIVTPPVSDNVLKGITAESVMHIAKDLGYVVEKRSIIRDELYLADELFFTGTAAEVTPIREVDGRVIGNGGRGPITERLQRLFFEIVEGKNKDYLDWLTVC